MTRVTLSLLAASILLALVPTVARAQSNEPAPDASSPPETASPAAPSPGAGAVVPGPQAIDDERPPNARPFSRRAVQAAERGRVSSTPQGRAASTMREHGLVGIVMGIVGLVGGLNMILGGLVTELADHSGVPLVIAGGACAGVGLLALITGGILFAQRAEHVEPGEVTLALGPGSLAMTAAF